MILGVQIDAYLSGALKVEYHFWILKSLKLIGHYQPNGGNHNTKESKNGG